MLRSVAVLVLPDLAVFEFGVLCEVFGMDRSDDGLPVLEFRVCGQVAGEPIATTAGVDVTPRFGLDGLRGADLVAIPATRMREFPEEVLEALRQAERDGATLLTVCSGVFVLAAAGILDGRRCTSHWHSVDELRARYPHVTVDPDVLYVDDGNLITSAGTAAGIDACLHLVRRELGSEVVNGIARRMVVPPQRDGGQRQFIERPIPECSADSLGPVLDWMLAHLDVEHSVADLARRAAMSERTFARRFTTETGTTPHRWLTRQRVLHARRLLEGTDLGVDAVAARCGFGSATLLRHHFRKAVGVAPADYRRSFRSSEPDMMPA
ncbi:MAG: helix-turn-helix domain-containing protein [Pseudonocardia sp.]|nr:helix-turn-helix domain-containing protein [Pseudonocardia sp.]